MESITENQDREQFGDPQIQIDGSPGTEDTNSCICEQESTEKEAQERLGESEYQEVCCETVSSRDGSINRTGIMAKSADMLTCQKGDI